MPSMIFNPLPELFSRVRGAGGYTNAHAHFDRAYSVTPSDLQEHGSANQHLFEKWKLVDALKESASEADYFQRFEAVLRQQKLFGVTSALSFVDCDPICEDRALQAAVRAKRFASEQLQMRLVLACQTLKGVLNSSARQWFERALEYVDVIGGLPGADKGHESEHLDVLLRRAKETGKRVHVHVDQLNTPEEKETELLARKTIEHGMEGRVSAVHGISVGAHCASYRKELYKMCRDAGLSFVCCPTAWLDHRRNEVLTPTHNALTPVDELVREGIVVALGTDNISDIYKPFSDGNMDVELRVLLEAAHLYEMETLVRIATKNGRAVIGLE